ncbi:hypothetical protein L345_17072, partial [Ophiophagus hannah]
MVQQVTQGKKNHSLQPRNQMSYLQAAKRAHPSLQRLPSEQFNGRGTLTVQSLTRPSTADNRTKLLQG